MEANVMKPGTRDEGGHALQEFQRGHDEMGGAIAVRGFELEHHLAGPGAAELFVTTPGQGAKASLLLSRWTLVPGYVIWLRRPGSSRYRDRCSWSSNPWR